jgi:hypothetical protein
MRRSRIAAVQPGWRDDDGETCERCGRIVTAEGCPRWRTTDPPPDPDSLTDEDIVAIFGRKALQHEQRRPTPDVHASSR